VKAFHSLDCHRPPMDAQVSALLDTAGIAP
jgi:hypothetical protein